MKQRILHKLHHLSGAELLIVASMAANFVNFFYSTYLGRRIGFVEFGLVSTIGSFLNISQIPLSSYSRSIVQKAAYLLGKYKSPASHYWRGLRKKSLLPTIVLTTLWLLSTPILTWYFKTDRILPFLIFTPVWFVGVMAAVDSGFLSGSHAFKAIAVMTIVEAVTKLVATIILVEIGWEWYVYLSIPIATVVSFLIGWWYARKIARASTVVTIDEDSSVSKKFFISSVFTKISSTAILSFDVLLAKHYLSAQDAGKYALLSIIGNIVYFLAALFSQFVLPFVSRDEGAGRTSNRTFWAILLVTMGTVGVSFVGIGVFGFLTVPVLFGAVRTASIVAYLPIYTAAMSFYALGTVIVAYDQAKNRHHIPFISMMTAVGTIIGAELFHNGMSQMTMVVFVNSILFLVTILVLHQFHRHLTPVYRNIEDFFQLFTGKYRYKKTTETLSILVFNWRDTKHSWAGGSETYIHELSKRWVTRGHRVTLFCGNDQKNPRNEVIDGVQIVRRGGFYMVYFWAFLYYMLRFRGNFDVVIDTENGIPFFSPLYVRVPTFLIIHHVHQEVMRNHLVFPLSRIAMFLESQAMPRIYRGRPVITVSDSSREEIISFGFAQADLVHVVYPGIDTHVFKQSKKTAHPSIVYLGRLKHYKHVDVAIKAFADLAKHTPGLKLTIAGDGTSKEDLMKLVKELKLEQKVRFVGKVSEEEKIALMGSSWVMVQPSIIEGWGLTVIEANACGTPVVASRVNGLRDSVVHEKTGLLFEPKNVADLTLKLDRILTDTAYRTKLSDAGLLWSKSFEWEECANSFLGLIKRNSSVKKVSAASTSPPPWGYRSEPV